MKNTFANLNRDEVVVALTPQMVSKKLYLEAYDKANDVYTDDVSLIYEVLNIKPQMVLGRKENIKI